MRGNETITVHRAGETDWQGDPIPDTKPDPRPVAGCIIWPRTTGDMNEGGVPMEGYNVFVPPPESDILADDVITARGKDWDIEGVPGDYRDKGGRRKGIIITLKRLGS